MDRAKYEPTGHEYWATDIKDMDPVAREQIRERLICTGCGRAAYYVPPTKRGACFFGARHEPDCRERSGEGQPDSTGSLPEADERGLRDDRFRLRPHRPRAAGHAQVTHDPSAADHRGRVRRYMGEFRGRRATPSVGLLSLLSKLRNDPDFPSSTKLIELPDGHAQVRSYCFNVAEITDEHTNRKKLYWGTIFSTKAGDDGSVWLRTEYGAPNLILKRDLLEVVMKENEMDELEEFAGASFIYLGYLNESRNAEWRYFAPKDPAWFAIRLATE